MRKRAAKRSRKSPPKRRRSRRNRNLRMADSDAVAAAAADHVTRPICREIAGSIWRNRRTNRLGVADVLVRQVAASSRDDSRNRQNSASLDATRMADEDVRL